MPARCGKTGSIRKGMGRIYPEMVYRVSAIAPPLIDKYIRVKARPDGIPFFDLHQKFDFFQKFI
jgi:hypothetical protein